MQRIGVTGASGFIGTAIVDALLRRGDRVRALVRDPQAAKLPKYVEVARFDAMQEPTEGSSVDGLDAVIHLAGENVGGRWSAEKKAKIYDSRVIGTRNLVRAIRMSTRRPSVLVSASASGYYGSRADEPLQETSAPGDDFLAKVCIDWEREAHAASELGTRVVCLRQGLVLDKGGGALEPMLLPFRLGIGGSLGSGRQWWPWIHREDDAKLFLFALDRIDLEGPVNAVAPDPATNARFSAALAHALRRPALVPAPRPALKVVLGEFSDSVLASALILPAVADDAGFEWNHPYLEQAMLHIFEPGSDRKPAVTHLEDTQCIANDLDTVFAFFSNVANLAKLTPDRFKFEMISSNPIVSRRGQILEHKVRVRGLPVHWKSLITEWKPKKSFADIQVRGPYQLWRHRHDFEARDGGVVVRDSLDYSLPLAPLSGLVLPLVRRDVAEIFSYRRSQMARLLAP